MVYLYTKPGCKIIISSGDKSRKSYFGNISPHCELDDSNPLCFLHDNLPHCTMVIPLQPLTLYFSGVQETCHHKPVTTPQNFQPQSNLITSSHMQNVNTRVLTLLRNCHLHAQNNSSTVLAFFVFCIFVFFFWYGFC